MGKRFCRLDGRWVIIGWTGMDFSLSVLFPFLAALANALYQITTRLLHRVDLPVTTLFIRRSPGFCSAADFCPLPPSRPGLPMPA